MADNLPITINGVTYSGLVIANPGAGGGTGTGDASAAKQDTQIARETSIRDQIGALTSPAAGSTNALLLLGNASYGTPADAAYADATGAASGSFAALLKGLFVKLSGTLTFRRYQNTREFDAAYALTTTAAQIFAADANRSGARIVNPNTVKVYLLYGTTGTPSSTNYHDIIPAATSTVETQWECPFAPVEGIRAALASGTGTVVKNGY